MDTKDTISNYASFISKVKYAIASHEYPVSSKWRENALKLVDGLAAEELRRSVGLDFRRKHGIFFTASELAAQVLNNLQPKVNSNTIFYDPACGAGNLLIATSNLLRRSNVDLRKTKLLGTDIHQEFVAATRLRLNVDWLLNSTGETTEQSPTVKIKLSDGLLDNSFYSSATDIIVNPPFNLLGDVDVCWANGKVSAAAVFIDRIVQHVNPGTSIYAILPDVLRSGTRYSKWRELLQSKCNIGTAKLLGQFDSHTDVDVYAIKLTKRANRIYIKPSISEKKNTNGRTLSDLFNVCVGPVVDNRDEHKGPKRKYVISKGLKGWMTETNIKNSRQHSGRSFSSPFIVVKRTSRLEGGKRAVATIIKAPHPVYVDNHLIVLMPKKKTLKMCKLGLITLQHKKTDQLLNKLIRCRHLTVKIISNIPVWE